MQLKESLVPFILECGMIQNYKAGSTIYLQEDNSHELYLILKGRVYVHDLLSNGSIVTLDVLSRGQIFGESSCFNEALRPTTVSAVSDVSLCVCTMESLYKTLQQHPDLALDLLAYLTQTNDYLVRLVKHARSSNRYEKIAAFLCRFKDVEEINLGIVNHTIPYSHEEIAESVGLARVTVSKVLKDFEAKGMIELGYRKIKILDFEALKLVQDK